MNANNRNFTGAFETKSEGGQSGNPGELKTIIQELGKTFHDFKQANDELLKAKADGKSVAELQEKLAKLNDKLTELDGMKSSLEGLEAKLNRPGVPGGGAQNNEHKQAFDLFLRKGQDEGLRDLEAKTLQLGVPADGGYALPVDQDKQVLTLARNLSPMRQVCNVVTLGTSDYRKLVNLGGTSSGWVGETDARPATNTSQFAQITPFMGELYANPQVTQNMLDDAFFDVEGFLNGELAYEFSRAEGQAFLTGDGVKKPKGLLAYASAAADDGTRAFGTFQYLATGVAGDWAASNPGDALIALVHKLKAAHRAGAHWMLNKSLLAEIRTFKDANGNYLWQPSLQAGQPSTLCGYGAVENEDMPVKAANALALGFGHFKAAYTIIDRLGTRILRDPYTNKPYVSFYTTKRVGGMAVDTEAVKFLKFAAS
jgi:HK97 family phage major capsid protein